MTNRLDRATRPSLRPTAWLSAVSVATLAPTSPAQLAVQTVQPFDSAVGDQFGVAVAVDGDRAVVRSNLEAYVFEQTSGQWSEIAKLPLTELDTTSNFGRSVQVLGDLIVVGTPLGDVDGNTCGSAHVYELMEGTWTFRGALEPSDPVDAQQFGYAIDIEEHEGTRRVLIGAPRWASSVISIGAAYLFEEGPEGWTEVKRFVPSDGSLGDWFGTSVSMSGDLIAIGSRLEDSGGQNAGAAYVYEEASGSWPLHSKLISPEASFFGEFGRSVDIDGTTLAIGEIRAGDGPVQTGAVHLFELRDGVFETIDRVLGLEVSEGDSFGISVDLDGDDLLVGACYHDDEFIDQGSAYTFERFGDFWIQTSRLVADPASLSALVGWSVARDGVHVLAGTLIDYGSGAGPPGSMLAFDPSAAEACTVYPYGASAQPQNELVLIAPPPDTSPWTIAVGGTGPGEIGFLLAGATPLHVPLGELSLLVDLSGALVVPMGELLGTPTVNLDPPIGPGVSAEAVYLQAITVDPATLALRATNGLRVRLCP